MTTRIPENLREAVLAVLDAPLPARTTMLLEAVPFTFLTSDFARKRQVWHNLHEDARISRVTASVFGTLTAGGLPRRFISSGAGFQAFPGPAYQRMFDFRWDMQLSSRRANTSLRTTGALWGMGSSIFTSSPTGTTWELPTPLDVIQGDSVVLEMQPTCWNPMEAEGSVAEYDNLTVAFTLHGWREKA